MAEFGARLKAVSIHAPAWGATGDGLLVGLAPHGVSIHAPAWGATHHPHRPDRAGRVSIHAPAWGATSCWPACGASRWCFNPRTRVGCDRLAGAGLTAHGQVSIHAPAWGATGACLLADLTSFVSIHAPAWGATPTTWAARPGKPVSIHAPAWGATEPCAFPARQGACFNPRTRVGCDCFHVLSSRFP